MFSFSCNKSAFKYKEEDYVLSVAAAIWLLLRRTLVQQQLYSA